MSLVTTESDLRTQLKYISCDFCGEDKTTLFLETENQETKEKFKIVRCCACGLIYLNPRPVKDIIARYYPVDSYYAYQDFLNKKTLSYREWLKKISLEGYYDSKNVLKKLVSFLLVRNFLIVVPKETKGRLLDIGCGSGEFLNQMKSFGWEVYGVEINPESASIGSKHGVNIFCGELGTADFADNFFDVVVLSQTLEHVYSPASYLERIYRLLREEGLLIIGVPNIGCLEAQIFGGNWHALEAPRHLYFFTVHSLRYYLEKYGFEVEKVLSKKFSLPLKGLKADLKSFIQCQYEDKSPLTKMLLSFLVILRLISTKSLRFLFIRKQANELGGHIAFYARKPKEKKKP
jgi:SAM-dependent methyltransferase